MRIRAAEGPNRERKAGTYRLNTRLGYSLVINYPNEIFSKQQNLRIFANWI